MYALSAADILPTSLTTGLDKLPNFSKWAKAVMAKESVRFIWDEETVVTKTRARLAKMKAAGN